MKGWFFVVEAVEGVECADHLVRHFGGVPKDLELGRGGLEGGPGSGELGDLGDGFDAEAGLGDGLLGELVDVDPANVKEGTGRAGDSTSPLEAGDEIGDDDGDESHRLVLPGLADGTQEGGLDRRDWFLG